MFELENKKQLLRWIRTHDLTRFSLKCYPLDNKSLPESIHGVFLILSNKKFSAQRSRKNRDSQKKN